MPNPHSRTVKSKPPRYTVETGVSLTDLGVVWPVIQHYDDCGCGSVELKRTIGYFTSRQDAEVYVSIVTFLEAMAADKHGFRVV